MTAKKTEWTVRIIVKNDDQIPFNRDAGRDNLWLGELLRYAGISKHLATFDEPEPGREVYELRCPHADQRGFDTQVWANMNAGRMRSFGIDAAAAPKWDGSRHTVMVPTT